MNVRKMVSVRIEEPVHNLDDVIVRQGASDESIKNLVPFLNHLGDLLRVQEIGVFFKTHKFGLTGYCDTRKAFLFIDFRKAGLSLLFYTGDQEIKGLKKANWLDAGNNKGSERFLIESTANLAKIQNAAEFAYEAYMIAANKERPLLPKKTQSENKQIVVPVPERKSNLVPDSDRKVGNDQSMISVPIQTKKEIDRLSPDRDPVNTLVRIEDGERGISYERLFLPYIRGARSIKVCDPWIRLHYQFNNLLAFCSILVPKAGAIELKLITKSDFSQESEVKENLNKLKKAINGENIEFDFELDDTKHDRWIETDTGWFITLGHGLDIFKKPEEFTMGIVDQTKRPCRATDITYHRIEKK